MAHSSGIHGSTRSYSRLYAAPGVARQATEPFPEQRPRATPSRARGFKLRGMADAASASPLSTDRDARGTIYSDDEPAPSEGSGMTGRGSDDDSDEDTPSWAAINSARRSRTKSLTERLISSLSESLGGGGGGSSADEAPQHDSELASLNAHPGALPSTVTTTRSYGGSSRLSASEDREKYSITLGELQSYSKHLVALLVAVPLSSLLLELMDPANAGCSYDGELLLRRITLATMTSVLPSLYTGIMWWELKIQTSARLLSAPGTPLWVQFSKKWLHYAAAISVANFVSLAVQHMCYEKYYRQSYFPGSAEFGKNEWSETLHGYGCATVANTTNTPMQNDTTSSQAGEVGCHSFLDWFIATEGAFYWLSFLRIALGSMQLFMFLAAIEAVTGKFKRLVDQLRTQAGSLMHKSRTGGDNSTSSDVSGDMAEESSTVKSVQKVVKRVVRFRGNLLFALILTQMLGVVVQIGFSLYFEFFQKNSGGYTGLADSPNIMSQCLQDDLHCQAEQWKMETSIRRLRCWLVGCIFLTPYLTWILASVPYCRALAVAFEFNDEVDQLLINSLEGDSKTSVYLATYLAALHQLKKLYISPFGFKLTAGNMAQAFVPALAALVQLAAHQVVDKD